MDLREAQKLAHKMMQKYGLFSKGWFFEFDRAKSRLGLTNFTKKKISISKYMTSVATRSQVEQVMLHEIAHALLPPSAKHGSEWKVLAKKIGYTGNRTVANPFQDSLVKENTVPKFGVKIGDKLKLPNGEYVVVRKAARKYFYLQSVTSGKWWKIPLTTALAYKI